ncbi:hypothetical protein S245_004910, partial [Arachis hypogaea]
LAYPAVVKRKQNSLTKKTVGPIKTHGNKNPESITSLLLDKEKIKTREFLNTEFEFFDNLNMGIYLRREFFSPDAHGE